MDESPNDRTPIILIPGVSGTMLRHRESGRLVWGDLQSFFLPRDGGYGIALPIDPRERERDQIEPFAPILRVRLGPRVWEGYRPLIHIMEKAGYVFGNLLDPRPGDNFLFFPYDWRYDYVFNARRLDQQLRRLREIRGGERLSVRLIAQSSAAHIARYFLKYGGGSLEEAESGSARPPEEIEIEKLLQIGTANGGSTRVLRTLNHGRRYVTFGRQLTQEMFFSYPSFFQDLPVYRESVFFDASGRALEIDLFDPANWKEYGWSIFASEVDRRLGRLRGNHPFADESRRDAYLTTQLRDARRFHDLLHSDVGWFGKTKYYSLQNVFDPTPDRALLTRERGEWRTYFEGDSIVDTDPNLRALAVAHGDLHATDSSQQWLSPQESRSLVQEPSHFEGGHFEIILNPLLHRKLLESLDE